jgi:hypothetical protein
MPTPRKSIAELMASGTYQRNKGRYESRLEAEKAAQAAKPPSAPIGRPPAHLTVDEKKVWIEIVKQSPALNQTHRLLLEVAVRLTIKLRKDGLKSAEMTKLISLLESFKGAVADSVNVPAVNTAPVEDTRSQYEKDWEEFAADVEEGNWREQTIRAEMEAAGRTYWEILQDLFPDEAAVNKKHVDDVFKWIDERRAKGLWTDNRQKQEEKVEYIPPPREPREPIVEDPDRKRELMLRRWSM